MTVIILISLISISSLDFVSAQDSNLINVRGEDFEKTLSMNSDGSIQGKVILGMPKWLQNSGIFVPYLYTESDKNVIIESAQVTFVFDKKKCSVSIYESGKLSLTPIIKSQKWNVYFTEVDSEQWSQIDFSNSTCDSKIIKNNGDLLIIGTQETSEGLLKVEYKKPSGESLESSAFFTNFDESKINHKFAFSEKFETLNKVRLKGEQTIPDLKIGKSLSLSKVPEKKLSFDGTNTSIAYDFTQTQNLFSNAKFQKNVDFTNTQIDFRNISNFPLKVGETISIDPIYGYDDASVSQTISSTTTGINCPSPSSIILTGGFRIQKESQTDSTFPCNLIAPTWDISVIEDLAQVTDVSVRYDIVASTLPITCDWRHMANNPSLGTAQSVWNDILDGIQYVDNSLDCTTMGAQKTLNLGPNSISNLENNLLDDWFSVGVSFNDMIRDGSVHTVDFANIQLEVDYNIPPESPWGLDATAESDTTIHLEWNPPSQLGDPPFNGYRIERQIGTGWQILVSNTGNTATTYVDSSMTTGTFAQYRVIAINSVLGTQSSPSNISSARTFSVPDAPVLATSVSGNQIDISWNHPNNGGSQITGYLIERAPGDNNFFNIETNWQTTTYSDSSSQRGITLQYFVSAINEIGTGPRSNIGLAYIETYQDAFSGTWMNSDPYSGGNNYLKITQGSGGSLFIQPLEKCGTSNCELGNMLDSSPSNTFDILSGQWIYPDRTISMDLTLIDEDNKLRADTSISYSGYTRTFVQTFVKTSDLVQSIPLSDITCFDSVKFDQTSYFEKDTARIILNNVQDPGLLDPNNNDSFSVRVWSDLDQEGKTISVTETSVDSGQANGFVSFEKLYPEPYHVRVEKGDTLNAHSCHVAFTEIDDYAENIMIFKSVPTDQFNHDYRLKIERDTDILLGNLSPVVYTVTIENNSPPSVRHVAFHVLEVGGPTTITENDISSSLNCWEPAPQFGIAVTCTIGEMSPNSVETLTITHNPIENHSQWSGNSVNQWFKLTSSRSGDAENSLVKVWTERITEINIPSGGGNGGGCLIATAAYGSEMASQVQQLRELRDNLVLSTESGTAFMSGFNQFYYSFSPGVSDLERENPVFKEMVKVGLTPMLSSLSLLNYVEINSEQEMLGYGISLITLNVGMYFVAPAIVIVIIRKRF